MAAAASARNRPAAPPLAGGLFAPGAAPQSPPSPPSPPAAQTPPPLAAADPGPLGVPASGEAPRATTPIFDSISVWFTDNRTPAARAGDPAQVIDLRETPRDEGKSKRKGGSGNGPTRWASLGDQRWLATTMRAAAGPEIAGNTAQGLPVRRPGANLLPSAAAAAGTPTVAVALPARRTDAESVRGRLGSYQRGLTSARRARHLPPDVDAAGLFTQAQDAGGRSGRQGGDS